MQAIKNIATSIGIGALLLGSGAISVAILVALATMFWDFMPYILSLCWFVFMSWILGSLWKSSREWRRSHG